MKSNKIISSLLLCLPLFLTSCNSLLKIANPIKKENSPVDLLSFSRSGSTDSYTDGYTFTKAASGQNGYYQDGSGTERSLTLYHETNKLFPTAAQSISFTAKLGGGSAKDPLTNSVYVAFVDKDGSVISGSDVVVTNKITAQNGSNFSVAMSIDYTSDAYGVKLYHTKESGYNVRYYSFSLSYVAQEISEDTPTISISSTASYGQIGDEYQFTKETQNFDSSAVFEWSSSNEEVATIDNDGLLSLKGIGSTIIRCNSGEVKSNAITIKSYPVADSTLSISEAKLVAELSGAENSLYSYYASGIVTNSTDYNFDLKDPESDEYIRVYKSSHGKNDDELVQVYGTLKNYNGTLEFDSPTISAITGKAAIQYALPKANLVFGVEATETPVTLNGYQKVTAEQADWSGNYLIVYESDNSTYGFDGSLTSLDAANNIQSINVDNTGYVDNSTNLYSSYEFSISAVEGGYSIQSSSGYYIGQTTYANGLQTSNSEPYVNTISYVTDHISITCSINNQDVQLKYNTASNQNRFRYYKSGQQDIQLYKKVSGSSVNTTYTPKNVKVNLGAILDGMNVLEFEDEIVSYGVAVATADNLGGKKLKDLLNEDYVGKSEVTLVSKEFVYCDSNGKIEGDEEYIGPLDYIIFSANLAIPETYYETQFTWAAYFVLNGDNIVITAERTESIESLAESYKANETLYNSFDEDVQKCIDYLAAYND